MFEDPESFFSPLGLTHICWLRIIEVNSVIAKARDQNPDVGRDSDRAWFKTLSTLSLMTVVPCLLT